MRWKWLLVLSLISISLVVASGDGDVEKVDHEEVKDKNDDAEDDYDDQVAAAEDAKAETDEPAHSVPDEEQPKMDDVDEPTNEDTVDVENVPIGKQQGKYMNYDDYFVASAIDQSDNSYNWNGECSNPDFIDWHIELSQLIKKLRDILRTSPLVTNTHHIRYLISARKILKRARKKLDLSNRPNDISFGFLFDCGTTKVEKQFSL